VSEGKASVFLAAEHEAAAAAGALAVAALQGGGVLGRERRERTLQFGKGILSHALDQSIQGQAGGAQQVAQVALRDRGQTLS